MKTNGKNFMKFYLSIVNDTRLTDSEKIFVVRMWNRIECSQGNIRFYDKKYNRYYAVFTISEMVKVFGHGTEKITKMIKKAVSLGYIKADSQKYTATKYFFPMVKIQGKTLNLKACINFENEIKMTEKLGTAKGFFSEEKKKEESDEKIDFETKYKELKKEMDSLKSQSNNEQTISRNKNTSNLRDRADYLREQRLSKKEERMSEERRQKSRDNQEMCELKKQSIMKMNISEYDANKILDATLYRPKDVDLLLNCIFIAKSSVNKEFKNYNLASSATSFEFNENFEGSIGNAVWNAFRRAHQNVSGKGKQAKNKKNYIIGALKRYFYHQCVAWLKEHSETFYDDYKINTGMEYLYDLEIS